MIFMSFYSLQMFLVFVELNSDWFTVVYACRHWLGRLHAGP